MIEDFHAAQLVRFGALIGRRAMFDYFQNYSVWILEGQDPQRARCRACYGRRFAQDVNVAKRAQLLINRVSIFHFEGDSSDSHMVCLSIGPFTDYRRGSDELN
jgi:hypothetical protein